MHGRGGSAPRTHPRPTQPSGGGGAGWGNEPLRASREAAPTKGRLRGRCGCPRWGRRGGSGGHLGGQRRICRKHVFKKCIIFYIYIKHLVAPPAPQARHRGAKHAEGCPETQSPGPASGRPLGTHKSGRPAAWPPATEGGHLQLRALRAAEGAMPCPRSGHGTPSICPPSDAQAEGGQEAGGTYGASPPQRGGGRTHAQQVGTARPPPSGGGDAPTRSKWGRRVPPPAGGGDASAPLERPPFRSRGPLLRSGGPAGAGAALKGVGRGAWPPPQSGGGQAPWLRGCVPPQGGGTRGYIYGCARARARAAAW
jgi:hypothetical protein